jgi:hypothetical protein
MAVTHPNPHGHRARLCLRIATLAAAVALVAPAATATATDPTPATGRHCAVELTQPAGGGPATIASETCFSTFAEALAFSTGGRVKVAPDIDPASLTSEIMDVPGTDGPGEAAVLAGGRSAGTGRASITAESRATTTSTAPTRRVRTVSCGFSAASWTPAGTT